MQTDENLLPAIVPPPGATIALEIRQRGWTQRELARRTGESLRSIAAIVSGKKAIDARVALKMERVIGVSAGTWLDMENDYRLYLARKALGGA